MCYFLYGSINSGINVKDYEKAIKNSKYYFNIGGKEEVNACVQNEGDEYRITSNIWDCETPLGSKYTNKKGLKEFADLLSDLKSVRGIKHITISKNWVGEPNEREVTVHIDDIDLLHFLANIDERTFYTIELYKKYY